MTRHHLLLLILLNALWGFNFVAGKAGTAVFGPMLFITLRFTIVLVLLGFFLRWVPGQMRRIIAMGLITLMLEHPQWQHLASIPLTDYWTVVYSAIGATIAGHGLLYYLLARYSVNSVAPFITLSTLFAIIFGVLFTGDTLTLKIAIGGGLTLLGVTIVAVRNARENAPSGIRTPR